MTLALSVSAFPPYHLLDEPRPGELDDRATRAREKTKRLEKLYDLSLEHGWDGRQVLDGLIAKHGGIHVPPDKAEALGEVFTVILWGELAAWNVSADLARGLDDIDARKAATAQAFDEARHFAVLREYLLRSGVPLPPLSALTRRVLVRIMEARSPLEQLTGMQMLVENLALAIFRRVAEARVEPVLSELLEYIERDESRHVGLGANYLPVLLSRAGRFERSRLALFSAELFALTIAQGRRIDRHWKALGIDHRELALGSFRLHQQMQRQMDDVAGAHVKGGLQLTGRQHRALVDFLHPADPAAVTRGHGVALKILDAGSDLFERALRGRAAA